jgi:ADP-ribose pyrophosphatase YjhB (NUDIX family)
MFDPDFSFCPNCGSPQLSKLIPPDDNRERQVCGECQTIHYHNPRIIVGTVPFIDGEVLLCRRAIDPKKGKWNLPCGFLELGEDLKTGALRETEEEAGVHPQLAGLHTVYSVPELGQHFTIFAGRLSDKKMDPGHETLEAAFFRLEDIPWDEVAFRSNRFCLKALARDLEAGSLSTHFGVYPE